ncbi:serine/threonine-protein kinase [Pengzhenrongella frigida]|uniref:Serine/threonine protein kinase n=1 Tax=Pengzhenrongella frigida TaxID=1259133 RepID=A0A4Q5MZR5_9MICO|nr:serine/threonine-protein kinase [Cellulomonas sp. HLT2-17]RYV51239.1 serine/threonine protein kinase [Cellulomonas sp. HLT2-17]
MERMGLAPGSEVGGYRIVAPLGSGGMGTVYRAVDGGGKTVALKLLHPHIDVDPVARDRLRREVAALQRLRHPAVAAVLDAEIDSTEAFVVTELVDGHNLEEHVRAHGPVPAPELARLATGLRDVLEAVHAAGVVHRDLKPSNVLVTDGGPVLIDFGIAQATDDAQLTSGNLVVGTPGYLAPELLADAEPSAVTDWWGWAAVLAFAATGRAPFGIRPMEAVLARSRAGDVDVIGLGPLTAGALSAALDPDPSLRALPDDVVADLTEAAEQGDPLPSTQVLTRTVGAVPPGPPTAATAAFVVPDVANDGRTRAFGAVPRQDDAAAVPDAGYGENPPPSVLPGAGYGPPRDDEQDHGGSGYGEPGYGPAGPLEPPPGYVAPQPRLRVGSVLALALLVIAGAALYPGVTAVVAGLAIVLFRTVGSAVAALHTRRERRGGVGRADAARAVAASPWHLLRALVGLVPSLLLGASVIVIVGGVLWWLLGSDRLVIGSQGIGGGTAPGGGNEPWVYSAALAAAMLGGLALVWFGPTSRLTRIGARRTLAALAPGNAGAVVLVVLALVGAGALVALVVTGQDVTWWPLPGGPELP